MSVCARGAHRRRVFVRVQTTSRLGRRSEEKGHRDFRVGLARRIWSAFGTVLVRHAGVLFELSGQMSRERIGALSCGDGGRISFTSSVHGHCRVGGATGDWRRRSSSSERCFVTCQITLNEGKKVKDHRRRRRKKRKSSLFTGRKKESERERREEKRRKKPLENDVRNRTGSGSFSSFQSSRK